MMDKNKRGFNKETLLEYLEGEIIKIEDRIEEISKKTDEELKDEKKIQKELDELYEKRDKLEEEIDKAYEM